MVRRDARGWLIPRSGTLHEKMYLALLAGRQSREIAVELQRPWRQVRYSIWRICHPDEFNRLYQARLRRQARQDMGLSPTSDTRAGRSAHVHRCRRSSPSPA